MVERNHDKVEVVGSIPTGPTKDSASFVMYVLLIVVALTAGGYMLAEAWPIFFAETDRPPTGYWNR